MFLNFHNEIRKKRWYVSDQHSAYYSVGLSRLESRGGEDGRAGNGREKGLRFVQCRKNPGRE